MSARSTPGALAGKAAGKTKIVGRAQQRRGGRAEIPDEGLEGVNCPMCGHEDPKWLFEEEGYPVWRCRGCGHIYVWPQPSEQALSEYYQSQYYSQSEDSAEDWEDLRTDIVRLTVRAIGRYHPRRGDLLEVGSGFGGFLLAAIGDGWRVEGIEPSASAVAAARRRFGDDVRLQQTIFEQAQLAPDSFDCVVMLNVIEHVRDPVGVCRRVHELLRAGGCLALRWPQSVFLNRLRRRPRLLGVPEHLHDFTRRSIGRLYQVAGFTDVRQAWSGTRKSLGGRRGLGLLPLRAVKLVAYALHKLSGGRCVTPFVARLALGRKAGGRRVTSARGTPVASPPRPGRAYRTSATLPISLKFQAGRAEGEP